MNNLDILSHLGLTDETKKPANINNTNNTNNTNDTNNKLTTTTLVWSKDQSKVESSLTSSPLGKPSQEQELLDSSCQDLGIKKMPGEWRGVKLDLFNNGINKDGTASLKLNIGVLRKLDGAQIALQASLNSSWDDGVRRGVDKTDWNSSPHWIRAKQHRKELSYLYDIRVSKIGLKQKGGGTEMVSFVYQDQSNTWCVDILREGQIYGFRLDDPLSNAQRNQGKMIATVYAGTKKTRLITAKELGI